MYHFAQYGDRFTFPIFGRGLRLLLAGLLMLTGFLVATSVVAHAQTDEPAPTISPTIDPTPIPDPTDVPTDPDEVTAVTIDRLVRLIETMIAEGGGAALIASLPAGLVVGMVIGIAVGFVLTRLTPTKTDDAAFDRLLEMGLRWLGAMGFRLVQVAPPTVTPPDGSTTTTTTTVKTEAQTVSEATPVDHGVVGGDRPKGWENWKPD